MSCSSVRHSSWWKEGDFFGKCSKQLHVQHLKIGASERSPRSSLCLHPSEIKCANSHLNGVASCGWRQSLARRLCQSSNNTNKQTKKSSSPPGPGYAEGPELCVADWERVVALAGPGVAAIWGVGGEPVWTWAWNWAICSGLASVFNSVFSCSSWELRSISSLICSFSTSTSSRTAYMRWLFTRSWKRQEVEVYDRNPQTSGKLGCAFRQKS